MTYDPRGRWARGWTLAIRILLLASTQATAAPADLGGDETKPAPVSILVPETFRTNLRPWIRVGEADFAPDYRQTRRGHHSARIVLGPTTTRNYQQIRQDFTADLRQGDEFRASVWVRSRGIREERGPYLALEFIDDHGRRLAIAHSGSPTASDGEGWERLTAEGTAPAGIAVLRLSLVLHAHGTGWFADPELVRTDRPIPLPDLGDALRRITVRPDQVIQRRFGGVGFHAFHHIFPTSRTELDEVVVKRWRELRPSFARVNHDSHWDQAKLDQVSEHLQYMKDTGTQLYVTTWDPEVTADEAALKAYVARVVGQLDYLVRRKGLTNIRYYCMTNEMTLGRWGALLSDLPTFKLYHQAFFEELRRRGLDIGLLATDAAPAENWGTLSWAAQHMDSITAVYGGHHYFSDRDLDDDRVYPWFLNRTRAAVGVARSRGKEFILGEFGSRQDGRVVNGIRRDVCVYFDTPQEPFVTLQLAEAAIAAMNAGVQAMGYWTFMDVPDDYVPGYLNKWGLFRCSGTDRSTRAPYYGYALLTRKLRGPGTVVGVNSSDPRLRVAALKQADGQSWSIAVVNRNTRESRVRIVIDPAAPPTQMARHTFVPMRVPQNAFGDLPGPDAVIPVSKGELADRLAPGSLIVYSTLVDRQPPAAIRGLKVEHGKDGRDRLSWSPSPEPDFCYYRVFSGSIQQGSTTATHFDAPPTRVGSSMYRVVAVDQEGNVSP